jgi:hypothetical protein
MLLRYGFVASLTQVDRELAGLAEQGLVDLVHRDVVVDQVVPGESSATARTAGIR